MGAAAGGPLGFNQEHKVELPRCGGQLLARTLNEMVGGVGIEYAELESK